MRWITPFINGKIEQTDRFYRRLGTAASISKPGRQAKKAGFLTTMQLDQFSSIYSVHKNWLTTHRRHCVG